MSKRKAILLEAKARCARITVANGFLTNAGSHLFLNQDPSWSEDDPVEGIAIVVGFETVGWQGDRVVVTLPINVQAIVLETDLGEPWDRVEDVITDIKKAMELGSDPDRTFGGLAIEIERGGIQTLELEQGSEFTGAQVPYQALYHEGWGQP